MQIHLCAEVKAPLADAAGEAEGAGSGTGVKGPCRHRCTAQRPCYSSPAHQCASSTAISARPCSRAEQGRDQACSRGRAGTSGSRGGRRAAPRGGGRAHVGALQRVQPVHCVDRQLGRHVNELVAACRGRQGVAGSHRCARQGCAMRQRKVRVVAGGRPAPAHPCRCPPPRPTLPRILRDLAAQLRAAQETGGDALGVERQHLGAGAGGCRALGMNRPQQQLVRLKCNSRPKQQ